jgi:hypothetical protein
MQQRIFFSGVNSLLIFLIILIFLCELSLNHSCTECAHSLGYILSCIQYVYEVVSTTISNKWSSMRFVWDLVSHSGEVVDVGLLGSNAGWTCRQMPPKFRRNKLPPSSALLLRTPPSTVGYDSCKMITNSLKTRVDPTPSTLQNPVVTTCFNKQ